MKLPRFVRWLGLVLCASAFLILATFAWMWRRVEAGLPPLDGRFNTPGLAADVTIARDDQGVVTITAGSEADAMRALGFAHGQDRFFQMDLLRRRAAGELSGLFGARALPVDRASVVHRFRTLAQSVVAQESPAHLALLNAYAEGVNAGLASLPKAPWEYAVVRVAPQPWTTVDCVLVYYAMVLDLQDSTGSYEQTLTTLRDVMGKGSVDFFNPLVGPHDSALDDSTAPLPAPPSAEVIDLRTAAAPSADTAFLAPEQPVIGSNAMALPGDRTATGAALLAGDPHLTLRVPNTWYRARLTWRDPAGRARSITGATLPGLPGVVIGSNEAIAWSFTNATVDTGDLVAVDLNPIAPELAYHRGTETLQFEEHTDMIEVRGDDPDKVESTWTVYGPIVARTLRGKPLAYHWTFHDPAAVNFALLDLAQAETVEQALAVAAATGMPNQNMFVVDRTGAAAWTITGRIPRRFGYDGRFPVSWTFGDRGWKGYLDAAERPVVRAAPGQALWSGNQRQIGGDLLERIGDAGYDTPARGRQLARDLAALQSPAKPADLLAIQLDERADWATDWRDLLLATLDRAGTATDPGERAMFREQIAGWDGHAAADSVGYNLLRHWQSRVANRTLRPIFARCVEYDPRFEYWQLRYDDALLTLHQQEPANLLDVGYASWDALRLAAVDDVLAELKRSGQALATATWGESNRLEMHHPFGDGLPGFVAGWINFPATPQAGDSRMPRVARPRHGASLRMVVSPGHEAEGIFHLPGGQSGNPLSPYYRAGHDAWLHGEPTPFLPGEPVHTLTLSP